MSAIGGPIETISIAGREFRCVGDAEVSRQLGGFTNEHLPNGDGSARVKKTRICWSLGGVQVEIDDTNGDQEFLEDVKDGADEADIVATYVNGESYAGVGNIDGEISMSNMNAAATFDLKGPGRLKKM